MYKKIVLENGLRIITHPMKKMQSVALGIWIRVGGRYETPEYKGIAHYLEHLAFKGSRKYSCRQIKESIEGLGGSLNGFTTEELTCYMVKLPNAHLDLALDILSDMVINPLLQPEEIEKERTVILEEIKMYKDLPQSYVYELVDELLWPNQTLGMTVTGTVESVSRINRENLSLFKKQYYVPANIVISAAGLLEPNKFSNKIKNIFSSFFKSNNLNALPKIKEEQHQPQLKLFRKDTEQTHLALGFHSFRRDHPLRYALGLLHIILGGNMSSRLFNELREKKGLAYEIGTQVKYFQDTGAFIVHAGIDNRKVNESVELIFKELEKAKDKPVGIDEFKRAKEFYLGQLALSLEETLDHMLWIGESTATLDRAFSFQDIVKEINSIKREDIREVAKSIFQEKSLNLALIGPLKDSKENLYRQLRLN